MDADELLAFRDLKKSYSAAGGLFSRSPEIVQAVDGVSFSLAAGETLGLVGESGCGKSTIARLALNLDRPDSGKIRFKDREISILEPHIITTLGISRTFQKARILPQLNCLQNVMTGCHPRIKSGMIKTLFYPRFLRRDEEGEIREKALNLLDLVGLSDAIERSGDNLSWIDCQLLQIARSLATDPELLILDEPTAGMGFEESRMVGNIIKQIRDTGITIILISHDMKLVMENADRVTVLDFGEKIGEGDPDSVKDDPRVLEAYLGTE